MYVFFKYFDLYLLFYTISSDLGLPSFKPSDLSYMKKTNCELCPMSAVSTLKVKTRWMKKTTTLRRRFTFPIFFHRSLPVFVFLICRLIPLICIEMGFPFANEATCQLFCSNDLQQKTQLIVPLILPFKQAGKKGCFSFLILWKLAVRFCSDGNETISAQHWFAPIQTSKISQN